MSDENFKQVQRLVALKRHEQPDDAYFEEFLDEFHRRQRQELLQRSSRSLFFERIGTWFAETNKWNLAMGGGAAYAVIMLGFFFWPKGGDLQPGLDTTPIEHVKEQTPSAAPAQGGEQRDMLAPDKSKTPVHETY